MYADTKVSQVHIDIYSMCTLLFLFELSVLAWNFEIPNLVLLDFKCIFHDR